MKIQKPDLSKRISTEQSQRTENSKIAVPRAPIGGIAGSQDSFEMAQCDQNVVNADRSAVRNFNEPLLSEISMPALDADSKQAAQMTVRIEPEDANQSSQTDEKPQDKPETTTGQQISLKIKKTLIVRAVFWISITILVGSGLFG